MKTHLHFLALAVTVTLSMVSVTSTACTSFLLSDLRGKVMGKSYDWMQKMGYVVTNKRNVLKKSSFPPVLMENPARWVSKYANVTFNQYGHEFPNGGMNEAGLAIEILWLDASVYPTQDNRPALNELQWVQYQLDSFASTQEVLAHADEVRIRNMYADTHYFVCDATGDCAVLEYLAGKLVTTSKPKLNPRAITNDTYADSRAFLSLHEPFGGTAPIPEGNDSLSRFVRASHQMKCAEATVERAFDVLNSVNVPGRTQWQIVYDLRQQGVSFRTLGDSHARYFGAAIKGPSCKLPVEALDIETPVEGDVSKEFTVLTQEMNLNLLKKSFGHLGAVGEQLSALVAAYPSTTTCLE